MTQVTWQGPREYVKQSMQDATWERNQEAFSVLLALKLGTVGQAGGFPLAEIVEGRKELV